VCPTTAAADWIVDAPEADLLAGRIRPDAVICCPATFNTLNKWAAGINDSLALGVLNDALGLGTPVLTVPMVAERLCRHPVWPATLAFLANAGVDTIDATDGQPTSHPRGIRSGTGDSVANGFDPESLIRWLKGGRRDPDD
jgi:phosphopantothenoylcysteine synthetase/decarboxylase